MPRHGRGGPTGPRWSCRLELGRLLIGTLGMAIFALAQLARAAPSFNPVYVDDRAQNYLMQFGYLPESGFETGNLRTDEQLRDAIRSLQRFGGVPETGIVDDRTRQLMSSRRCGLKDKPDLRLDDPDFLRRYKRFTLHGSPWKHLNLTWSLRTERPSGLDTGGVRRELSRALDLWAKNSKLTFKEINSDTADILVYFHRGYHGDGYPFDGRGQILAHAFFPGHDRGGDAHFDEEEEWTLGNNESDDGTSLFAVAAHEFGHSLGLAHSSVPGALMYPWYQGITKDYVLPDDDKHGIQQMYGAPDRLWGKNPDYPGYRAGYSRPASPASTTSTTTTTSTTSPRPWPPRERPYRPNHYPEDRPRRPHHYPEERPHRPNHYPEERPRNPYYPTKSDWPSRAPAPPTTTTTTTMTTTTTTTTTSTSTRRAYRPQPSIGTVGTSSPPPRHRPTLKKNLPDKCDTSYDAISLIRRELFIFKDKYVWRINDRGLVDGFPAEITQLFKFPMPVDHVDAVYERLHDNRIVFFIGRKFYVFNAFYLEPGYPQPLTALGLPAELPKIDAAMIWGYNKRTYFFSGDQYWRFDESENHVELDYPRDIKMFAGVGRHIDAVFQWKNGTTYFFKDKHFWQFDDDYMRVAHRKPKSSAHYWMGCPPGLDTNDVDLESAANPRVDRISASRGATLAFTSVPRSTIIAATLLSLLSLSSVTWYT